MLHRVSSRDARHRPDAVAEDIIAVLTSLRDVAEVV